MDIVTLVQTELNESGSGVFWPIQQVYDLINEVQVETFPLQYLPITHTTMTFTAGQDITLWPNTVIMWPHYLESNGRQYWIIKHADLERYDRNWRNASPSAPTSFVLWDESHIRPWPPPDQTYTFNVWGPAWPAEILSTNTDVASTTPNLLRHALAMRAAAYLFQPSRPDMTEAHNREADEYEAKYRIQWRRQNGDNIKRLRPGTAYTHAQAGNIRIGKRIDGNPSNPYR